ncbi:efflux RND transporter periplasmic adaptor subunit [Halomonas denitrificans]|nr:efflux RND transporter periplasmic adaptor subunit [Halomonas denitrificans]
MAATDAWSQQPAPVSVAEPALEPAVEQVELTGSFRARRAASLSPRLGGLVESIEFEAGDRVEAGQRLVQLDDRLAELELAQAEADVTRARAAYDEAVRLRDEGQRLAEDRFLPDTEIRARVSGAEVARAELAVAEAARDTAAERVAFHRVLAPFDGVVAQRMIDEGEWVETGTAVGELVAIDALWLEVQAPQRLWPRLGRIDGAEVTVDAIPDRRFAAELVARVPVGDPDARTFLVRLVLTDADPDITPGMSARARFRLLSDGEVLLVPRDALIRYPDGTVTLFIVERSVSPPVARQREVVLGRVDGDRAVVVEGLDPDAPVVVRGNETLVDGQPVRIVDPAGS